MSFYAILQAFDKDSADGYWRDPCAHCPGGRLHRADFPRSPAGHPPECEACFGWNRRHSFCCSAEGCRKRMTPPSVRFLGRKHYLGVVVTLATAMTHGLTGPRLARLREKLGVDRRTLERWRAWWREAFPATPFWRVLCGRLAEPLEVKRLPASLVNRFDRTDDGMLALLKTIGPITTASCPDTEGRAM